MPLYPEVEPDHSNQKALGQKLLKAFEEELRTARRNSDPEQMKLVFRKYYSLPQQPDTTVALVVRYYDLYPEIAGEDEFLRDNVLSIPGMRKAVTKRSPYLPANVSKEQRPRDVMKMERARQTLKDPEVAKRRALVKANPDASACDMCEIWDRASVPLRSKWQAAGFRSWADAYLNPQYRTRIDTLISKDRRSA